MTLSDYLRPRGRLTALAAKIDRKVSTLHGWKKGRRRVSLSDALLIEKATEGEVTVAELVIAERSAA